MEALSVGMYVRTLNGIVKIDKIQDNVMKDTKGYSHYGDFIKASYNIIDILEEGDYVNGCYIQEIKSLKDNVMVCMLDSDYEFTSTITNKDIKTIVTHEQIEQISYRIGE